MPEDRGLIAAARDIARHYRRNEIDPLREVWRRLWEYGTGTRLLIVLLAVSLLLAAVRPGLVASLALFVIAWSAALAASAATRRGLVPVLIVAPWLALYATFAATAWFSTPIIVLPIAWIAVVVWLLLPRHRPAMAMAWWLLASMGAAYVAGTTSGLRRVAGLDLWTARAIIAAAMASAAFFLRRPATTRPPGFTFVLCGSLAVIGGTMAASAWRDAASTLEWVQGFAFVDASATVVLLWLWTAGGFAAGSLKLAGVVMDHAGRALAGHWIRIGLPSLITAATLLRAWTASPSIASDSLDASGVVVQIAISVLTIAWLAVQAVRGATPERLFKGFTIWLLSWAVVEGIVGAAHGVADAANPRNPIAGAALVAIFIGLLVELAKLGREWAAASAPRVAVHLGFIVVAVSCAAALMITGGNEWQKTQSLMALTGMIHLGLPLAVYEGYKRWTGRGIELPASWRIGMFAAGYLSGLIALAIEPRAMWPLANGVLLLMALSFAMRRALPSAAALAGALAGALFGGGAIAGWMLPYPPTIPFLPVMPLAAVLRDLGSLGRPLLAPAHLATLMVAWGVCAAIGWTVLRNQTAREVVASYQTP